MSYQARTTEEKIAYRNALNRIEEDFIMGRNAEALGENCRKKQEEIIRLRNMEHL